MPWFDILAVGSASLPWRGGSTASFQFRAAVPVEGLGGGRR